MSKFRDKALHARAVAAAKRKFAVWPSAYASGYVVQQYKRLYKEKHGSMSGAFRGESLSTSERKQKVARKRSQDPNPNRKGKAIMTSSKTQSDAYKLGNMLKAGSDDRQKVRDRLAKIMDGYKKKNSC